MQRIIVLLALVVSLSPVTVLSQTRKRSTARPPAPKVGEAQRAGAARVADQIKILTRFIYLLGGVAKGLEGVDDAARRNEASPAILES